jgi:hypothetical protein
MLLTSLLLAAGAVAIQLAVVSLAGHRLNVALVLAAVASGSLFAVAVLGALIWGAIPFISASAAALLTCGLARRPPSGALTTASAALACCALAALVATSILANGATA